MTEKKMSKMDTGRGTRGDSGTKDALLRGDVDLNGRVT